MPRGKLIAFEGIDNSGKDSAILYFNRLLNSKGYRSTIIPSVSNTQLGRLIRLITTYKSEMRPNPDQLVLMFIADFYSKLDMIEEALSTYDVVLCSRWYTSTMAYCSSMDDIRSIENLIKTDIKPDVLFYLKISVETSMKRNTKMYMQGGPKPKDIYTNKLYLEEAKKRYDVILDKKYNTVIIDGEYPNDMVYDSIIKELIDGGIVNDLSTRKKYTDRPTKYKGK